MKSFIPASLLVCMVSAASIGRRTEQCCFQLSVSGGQSGSLGQLSDGQNRVGGSMGGASYCIDNGGLTDQFGRGCILTPPTTQFQCDSGASPSPGFCVGSNGQIEHDGSTTFYACPATETEYNIYTTPVAGQDKCVEVTLTAANSQCYGSCPGSGSGSGSPSGPSYSPAPSPYSTPVYSSPPASGSTSSYSPPVYSPPANSSGPYASSATPCITTASSASPPPYSPPASPSPVTSYGPPMESSSAPVYSPPAKSSSAPVYSPPVKSSSPAVYSPAPSSSSPPAPSSSSSSCPDNLSGTYQYPHLIKPVCGTSEAAGSSYNGVIGPGECSIYNFDIPSSYSGSTCSIVFLLPEVAQLETSSYSMSSSGSMTVDELESPGSASTTCSSKPAAVQHLGSFQIQPGSKTVLSSGPCEAGKTISYELGSSQGFALTYFQDYNPCPIGLYVEKS